MPEFKGNNDIRSVARLAHERAKYKTEAFPENDGLGPEQIVDFHFVERTFYGRVNRQLESVEVNSEYIIPLGFSNVSLMDFVAEAFSDFERHFVKACKLGLIDNDDPFLSSINPVYGYTPAKTDYDSYIEELIATFSVGYLGDRKKKINSFEDYCTALKEFLKDTRDTFPLTYSSWVRSNKASIFHSGLAVDIAGLDPADDSDKQEFFLRSPSFNYYLNVAKQYGFSVSKNAPWVLVADLAHPVMTTYRKKYDLLTVDTVFEDRYTKAYYKDIEILNDILISDYNYFVNVNNIIRDQVICNNKIKNNIKYRRKINTNINESNILNRGINSVKKILFDIYLYSLNLENQNLFTNTELNVILSTSLRLEKISRKMSMDYINDQFRSRFQEKNGTLTEALRRQKRS
jgi:hypothetical protein